MKDFKMYDLQTGDIVVNKDNETGIVINTGGKLHLIVWEWGGSISRCSSFTVYDTNLNHTITDGKSIQNVYRPRSVYHVGMTAYRYGVCLYDRHAIEMEKEVEMTMEEVCQALGKHIKIIKEK